MSFLSSHNAQNFVRSSESTIGIKISGQGGETPDPMMLSSKGYCCFSKSPQPMLDDETAEVILFELGLL